LSLDKNLVFRVNFSCLLVCTYIWMCGCVSNCVSTWSRLYDLSLYFNRSSKVSHHFLKFQTTFVADKNRLLVRIQLSLEVTKL